MSLFWRERQHTLLHVVTRDVHIINSLNNFEIFINDHTMSRVTIYFFFRYWIQKCQTQDTLKSFFLSSHFS